MTGPKLRRVLSPSEYDSSTDWTLILQNVSLQYKNKNKNKQKPTVLTRLIKFRPTEGNNIDTQQIITFIQYNYIDTHK